MKWYSDNNGEKKALQAYNVHIFTIEHILWVSTLQVLKEIQLII